MSENYFDYFEDEDENFADQEKHFEFEDDEYYPSTEEYNRIHKQKYNYFQHSSGELQTGIQQP